MLNKSMIIDTFNSGLILTQVKSIRLNSVGKPIITTTNKNYGEFYPVDNYWVYRDSFTDQVHILYEEKTMGDYTLIQASIKLTDKQCEIVKKLFIGKRTDNPWEQFTDSFPWLKRCDETHDFLEKAKYQLTIPYGNSAYFELEKENEILQSESMGNEWRFNCHLKNGNSTAEAFVNFIDLWAKYYWIAITFEYDDYTKEYNKLPRRVS